MKSTRFALLVTTALIVPAAGFAQTAETACDDLEGLIVAGLPASVDDGDRLQQVVTTGDGAACLVEVERVSAVIAAEGDGATATSEAVVADTAQTTLRLQDEVTVAGRVLLETTPPQVSVQGGETDVEVDAGTPSVTVSEQAADIVIRQAAANVTIEMPTPTIRIEQPAPEIIVTMPDPNVTVGAAQPQVRVVQADPVVTVTQAPPAVQLELAPVQEGEEGGFEVSDARTGQSYAAGTATEAVETEDADVTFTGSEPRVVLTDPTAEADVQIERAQPNVTFEQAEATVNFTPMGEPQVEIVQSGEPTVTFEQAAMGGDAAGTDAAAMDTAATGADTTAMPAATDTATATDTADTTAMPVEADATATADTTATGDAAAVVTDAQPLNDAAAVTTPPADTGLVATDAQDAEVGTDGAVVAQDADVAMTGPMVEREGYSMAQAGEYEVGTLVGANVYSVNDEDIGEIGDLVVGSDGTIDEVIVEVGGFLGLGEKMVRLPFDRFTVLRSDTDDLRTYIDATEDELEAMPENQ